MAGKTTVPQGEGKLQAAEQSCAEGLTILGKTLGPDASYTKSMAATCAGLSPPRLAVARRR